MNFSKLALVCVSAFLCFSTVNARNVVLQSGQIQTFPGYIEVSYEGPLTGPGDELDVLFVIDDSGSMVRHQQKLIEQSQYLIQNFLANPYSRARIGVMTTSVRKNYSKWKEGELHVAQGKNYVDRDTQSADIELARLLDVGVMGDPEESPLQAISTAISPGMRAGPNAGFFRADADLKIILITDAEDHSKISVDQIVKELTDFKAGHNVSVDALLATGTDANCQKDDHSALPNRNTEFVTKMAGKIESICSPDYAKFLSESIKSEATSPAIIAIPLPSTPEAETLKVTYGTQTLLGGFGAQGWIYNEEKNQITIGAGVKWTAQPNGTPVRVRYVPADWK